jgi:hypothetical protein
MFNPKLFVSATDATGGFTARGMVGRVKALEAFDVFDEDRQGGRAVFMVLSNHDGRIELRHGPEGIAATVVVRAAREAALWGLLPAREAVVWQPRTLAREEAAAILDALYRLPAAGFRAAVTREMTG